MPMKMEDLQGDARNMALRLMDMDALERMRILEVVNELTYRYREPDLEAYTPGLLWSRAKVESCLTEFFTASIWNLERQGKAPRKGPNHDRDWTWTNMTMDSQLTYPLHFEREEIRIYCEHPEDDERLRRIATPLERDGWYPLGGVVDHFGQSVHTKLAAPEDVRHIPLPEPAHPYDRDRAKDLLALVNGRKLPCVSWTAPRKIRATECFFLEVGAPGDPEPFGGFGVIAVYVGTLHAPKAEEA